MENAQNRRVAIALALGTIYEQPDPDTEHTLFTQYIQGELDISQLIKLLEDYKQSNAGESLPLFVHCEPNPDL